MSALPESRIGQKVRLVKTATMKDCFGEPLVEGDMVVIVAPSSPMGQMFLHMSGQVVKRRGRKVGIRFPDSDYVKYTKYVLPDCIQKASTWTKCTK